MPNAGDLMRQPLIGVSTVSAIWCERRCVPIEQVYWFVKRIMSNGQDRNVYHIWARNAGRRANTSAPVREIPAALLAILSLRGSPATAQPDRLQEFGLQESIVPEPRWCPSTVPSISGWTYTGVSNSEMRIFRQGQGNQVVTRRRGVPRLRVTT